MTNKKTKLVYILDTSAILSGKPLNLDDIELLTTCGVSKELQPGGRDYFQFQILIERGLKISTPSEESTRIIDKTSIKTGDKNRLSETDREILALALDVKKDGKKPVIVTDDYSIQNVSQTINIDFSSVNQQEISRKIKWIYQCRGCGKKYKENIKMCPICGANIRNIISKQEPINTK